MPAEVTTKSSNPGLLYGLLGGLAMSVFLLLLYLGGVEYFMSAIAWLGYCIIITIAILGGLRQKKLNGGYITFGQALKVVFTIFALAFLIQTTFSYILLNHVDTSFRDNLTQATLVKTEEMLKKFGASDAQIEEAVKRVSEQDSYSIKNILLGYGMMCILFFLVSLIIAAIIKRKPQPFENSFNQ